MDPSPLPLPATDRARFTAEHARRLMDAAYAARLAAQATFPRSAADGTPPVPGCAPRPA